MIRRLRASPGEYVEPLYYSVLSALVAWLVPAAIQFDEGDPLLGAGLVPSHRVP